MFIIQIILIINIALFLSYSAFSTSSLFCPEMECPSHLFKENLKEKIIPLKFGHLPNFNNKKKNFNNLFYFIALTQDCQFVISRPDQLPKLSLLSVNYKLNDCSSNKIKLIWQFVSSKPSLLLIQKRSENEICILPIETPNFLNIQGNELFSYSLYSSLIRFAKCSYLNGINIQIESFIPDLLYSDLFYIYFSSIFYQLRLSLDGQIRLTGEQFSVNLMKELVNMSNLIFTTDSQTKRLFIVPKQPNINSIVEYTSPFDILYRKDQAKFNNFQLIRRLSSLQKQWKISSFSVDGNLIIFTVSNYSSHNFSKIISTELFIAKIPNNNSKTLPISEIHCALNFMTFDVKFMIISEKTIGELTKRGALPQMVDTIIEKTNKINKYKHTPKQINDKLKEQKQQKTIENAIKATTTKSTNNLKSFTIETPMKTTEKHTKTTTKQTLIKTTTETAKQKTKEIKNLTEQTTTKLFSTKQTTSNLNSEKSELIYSIPIREKGENNILLEHEREQTKEEEEEEKEEKLSNSYIDDFGQQPLTLEEELEEDEEYNNLLPLPGEEIEEEKLKEENQKQTESQTLNSAIIVKILKKWILLLFIILLIIQR